MEECRGEGKAMEDGPSIRPCNQQGRIDWSSLLLPLAFPSSNFSIWGVNHSMGDLTLCHSGFQISKSILRK